MPLFVGNKHTFRDFAGNKPIREIFVGNQRVYGFVNGGYVASEWTGEKAPAGSPPIISGSGSSLSVKTDNYNPGYAFSNNFCDHVSLQMQYSGSIYFFDYTGREIVAINGTVSFNYLTAKWTIGSKCVVNGTTLFDSSSSSTDIAVARLSYDVWYDTPTKTWKVNWNNGTYTSGVCEWCPFYVRLMPQMWFISSTAGFFPYDGYLFVSFYNKAVGYKGART